MLGACQSVDQRWCRAKGEHPFASPISRSISHLRFFLGDRSFASPICKCTEGRSDGFEPGDPMISRRTLSPLDYRTVAAAATENLSYLCTVAGPDPDPNARGEGQLPDPDPNPRGGGQLPNPKSAILR